MDTIPQQTSHQVTVYLPDLRRYARFLVRDPHQADDLVQDALVRALGGLQQYRDGTNLRAWLFTILRNVFFEQARRRRTERAAIEQATQDGPNASPGEDHRLDVGDLQRCLFSLSPLLRDAIVLVGAHELSYEEAAVICGVPAGTVKARVSRAREQIARLMQARTAG